MTLENDLNSENLYIYNEEGNNWATKFIFKVL